jgi:hypothetical protein
VKNNKHLEKLDKSLKHKSDVIERLNKVKETKDGVSLKKRLLEGFKKYYNPSTRSVPREDFSAYDGWWYNRQRTSANNSLPFLSGRYIHIDTSSMVITCYSVLPSSENITVVSNA